MGRMFNLPHPGDTLREDILPALRYPASSTAMPASPRKWPGASKPGWDRNAAATRNSGWACKWITTYGKRNSAPRR